MEIQMDLTGLPRFVAEVFFFHEPLLNHPFVTQELGPAEQQEGKSSLAGPEHLTANRGNCSQLTVTNS